MQMKRKLDPIPPGEILLEEFMKPLGLSASALGRALDVPPNRISDVVRARREITADTALRLARYFRTSPEFWLNLQSRYDLERAKDERLAEIERTVAPRAA
jgi:addiction module HigA family antidote